MKKDEIKETTFVLPKVTRVEVIQHSEPHNGRAYTKYDAKDVEIQYQDDGKTLKIFLKWKKMKYHITNGATESLY